MRLKMFVTFDTFQINVGESFNLQENFSILKRIQILKQTIEKVSS